MPNPQPANFSNIAPRVARRPNPVDRFAGLIRPPTVSVDGIFEGGAALGTAYAGCLRALDDGGVWFKRVAGNSAGAITAALVAAGYHSADIEWLLSSYRPTPRRPAGVPASLNPVQLMSFLDLPNVQSISQPARRATVLWRALKGEAIDNLLARRLPIPTRGQALGDLHRVLDSVVPGYGAMQGAVDSVLQPIVQFLPTTQPRISDFQLFDTAPLREAFADAVWGAVASVSPMLVMGTQLLHEGSIFQGQVALETIGRLLGAKVHGNPAATVQFNQLPIPLAVIGANIATGRMEIYSPGSTPTMLVAEAVRRSMSLPAIFEPRGNRVVDGGLCSNFPAWLMTVAGDRFWPASSIDASRPKVGFTLSEDVAPPASWGVGAGKFAVAGNPPAVDTGAVLAGVVVAALRAAGLPIPQGNGIQLPQLEAELGSTRLIEVLMGSAMMMSKQEDFVRDFILRAMFSGVPYYHVNVPLLGFHGLDFAINDEKDDVEAIAERGWYAARDGLDRAMTTGGRLFRLPLSAQSPY